MTDLLASYSTLISIIIAFGAGTSVLFLVIGAVKYQTSSGNPQRMESAKTTMVSAVVGLVVMLMAFPAVNMITSTVGEAPGAIQVQQVAGTDTQRLDSARVVSVQRAYGATADTRAVVITFTEPVTVEGTVRLGTDRGALTLKTAGSGTNTYSLTASGGGVTGGIAPSNTETLQLFFGWGGSTVNLAASGGDGNIVTGTEIKSIIFERGASIRDSDGNNALVAFDGIVF